MNNPTQYHKVTLTAAQMSASFTTARTILPAQGANKVAWVKSVKMTYRPTSGSAVVGGNATTLKTNSATICSQDFNGISAAQMYYKTNSLTSATATHANQSITIQTATANPTFYGDLDVELEYEVISLV
jgi:hypothetical protein